MLVFNSRLILNSINDGPSTSIALFIVGFAGLSLPESMQAPSPLVPALKSNWLMMHVTVMMLSYASLIVGSLLGIFFLILILKITIWCMHRAWLPRPRARR